MGEKRINSIINAIKDKKINQFLLIIMGLLVIISPILYYMTTPSPEFPELSSPSDGKTSVNLSPVLSWTGGNEESKWYAIAREIIEKDHKPIPVEYNIHFSSNKQNLNRSNTHTCGESCGFGPFNYTIKEKLEPNTTYYWMVTADNHISNQPQESLIYRFTTAPRPKINYFKPEKDSLTQGEATDLCWSVDNATELALTSNENRSEIYSSELKAKCKRVEPQEDTLYVLTATSDAGYETNSTNIFVAYSIPKIIDFNLNGKEVNDTVSVKKDDYVELHYDVDGAADVRLNPSTGKVLDYMRDNVILPTNKSMNYTFFAYNKKHGRAERHFAIIVN